MTSKYYTIGFDTGYDIANTNISEYDSSNPDKFISDMAEHESDVYRQYSPFEFLAQEMNRGKNSDKKWEEYDNGVMAGIQQATKELEA
jgi:hypothetical protein